jgi:hypothetical protein
VLLWLECSCSLLAGCLDGRVDCLALDHLYCFTRVLFKILTSSNVCNGIFCAELIFMVCNRVSLLALCRSQLTFLLHDVVQPCAIIRVDVVSFLDAFLIMDFI